MKRVREEGEFPIPDIKTPHQEVMGKLNKIEYAVSDWNGSQGGHIVRKMHGNYKAIGASIDVGNALRNDVRNLRNEVRDLRDDYKKLRRDLIDILDERLKRHQQPIQVIAQPQPYWQPSYGPK